MSSVNLKVREGERAVLGDIRRPGIQCVRVKVILFCFIYYVVSAVDRTDAGVGKDYKEWHDYNTQSVNIAQKNVYYMGRASC